MLWVCPGRKVLEKGRPRPCCNMKLVVLSMEFADPIFSGESVMFEVSRDSHFSAPLCPLAL